MSRPYLRCGPRRPATQSLTILGESQNAARMERSQESDTKSLAMPQSAISSADAHGIELPLQNAPHAFLDAFARLAIGIGVNIQPDQELIIAAPLEAAQFVRRLASAAYARGASLVTALYDDPELLLTRLLEAQADELDTAEVWLANSVAQKLREGAAHLSVLGPRPELLAGVDVSRIIRAHNAQARAHAMQAAIIANMETNASAVPVVTSAWARQVFPERESEAAKRLLWSALLDGLGGGDPTTYERTARQHLRALSDRRAQLQSRAFCALRFTGPAIQLTIGLAEGHVWRGGQGVSARGVAFTPVLPTEAIFTATDPVRAEGMVAFSRPITIAGEQVEGLKVRFEAGAVASVTAKRGQHAFEQLLDSDPGARRIGKVALVEVTAPFARQDICFHNPMLDGAAAPHLAFGAPSPATLRDAAALRSANQSAIHIDAMFDAAGLSVDGIDATGAAHAVLREGVFVL
jgi:aminopeptidase